MRVRGAVLASPARSVYSSVGSNSQVASPPAGRWDISAAIRSRVGLEVCNRGWQLRMTPSPSGRQCNFTLYSNHLMKTIQIYEVSEVPPIILLEGEAQF